MADQLLKERDTEFFITRSKQRGRLLPMGRGNAELTVLRQTQKHLYHPITSPSSKKMALNAQGKMWMCLQLVPILPKPTFTPRRWVPISKTEVTSPIQGKASQTGFARTTTKRKLNFHLVFLGALRHFLCHKKDDTGVPTKLQRTSILKRELTICHKPQDRHYTPTF